MSGRERAQSINIGLAFVAIIVVAAIVNLLAPAFDQLYSVASTQTTNSTAQTGLDWLKSGWDVFPFVAVGIIAAGTVAAAAFQRRGGR